MGQYCAAECALSTVSLVAALVAALVVALVVALVLTEGSRVSWSTAHSPPTQKYSNDDTAAHALLPRSHGTLLSCPGVRGLALHDGG